MPQSPSSFSQTDSLSLVQLAAHYRLSPVRTRAAGSLCIGVEGSWSWHDCSPDLARYFLPLVHFSAVLCKFVLAREAITFSVVLASYHRAQELGGILAVPGRSVADEVRPTPRAEAVLLDRAAEWGFAIFKVLPVMGLLMRSTIERNESFPVSRETFLGPKTLKMSIAKPATIQMTRSVFMTFPVIKDTYSKTHHTRTFLGGAYAR